MRSFSTNWPLLCSWWPLARKVRGPQLRCVKRGSHVPLPRLRSVHAARWFSIRFETVQCNRNGAARRGGPHASDAGRGVGDGKHDTQRLKHRPLYCGGKRTRHPALANPAQRAKASTPDQHGYHTRALRAPNAQIRRHDRLQDSIRATWHDTSARASHW